MTGPRGPRRILPGLLLVIAAALLLVALLVFVFERVAA